MLRIRVPAEAIQVQVPDVPPGHGGVFFATSAKLRKGMAASRSIRVLVSVVIQRAHDRRLGPDPPPAFHSRRLCCRARSGWNR